MLSLGRGQLNGGLPVRHILPMLLTAFCVALPEVASSRTSSSAQSALTPEEVTVFLMYGIPPSGLRKTEHAFFLDGVGTTRSGQSFSTTLRIGRNLGCRVEIEDTSDDPDHAGAKIIEKKTYDWSKVSVDRITISQVLVPGQATKSFYRTVEIPGGFGEVQAVLRTKQGDEIVQSRKPMGSLSLKWAYVPGQPNAYSMRRGHLAEILKKCAGKAPSLPE